MGGSAADWDVQIECASLDGAIVRVVGVIETDSASDIERTLHEKVPTATGQPISRVVRPGLGGLRRPFRVGCTAPLSELDRERQGNSRSTRSHTGSALATARNTPRRCIRNNANNVNGSRFGCRRRLLKNYDRERCRNRDQKGSRFRKRSFHPLLCSRRRGYPPITIAATAIAVDAATTTAAVTAPNLKAPVISFIGILLNKGTAEEPHGPGCGRKFPVSADRSWTTRVEPSPTSVPR